MAGFRVLVLIVLFMISSTYGVEHKGNQCSEELDGGRPRGGRFRSMMPKKWKACGDGNAGSPLFLTPFIYNGSIDQAVKLSRVEGVGEVASYSGYLTVNEKYGSNMFFWFFPAQEDPENAPVVLWLQGGPGASSLFGLFVELGPLSATKDGKIGEMPVTWNKKFSLLYIDNPVGTGYSFTNDKAGYASNEGDVTRDLFTAINQFFAIFENYQTNGFYVTGESYAGKYVPELCRRIVQWNSGNPHAMINFKGMAIGDGWTDPLSMYPAYPDLMHQLSVIDSAQAEYAAKVIDGSIVPAIARGDFLEAFMLDDSFMGGDLTKYPTWYFNATGSNNYFNILHTDSPPEEGYFGPVLVSDAVRRAIHVGNMPYGHGNIVEDLLRADIANSSLPAFLEVLNSENGLYKVMVYNGQLDIIVGVPLTERMCSLMDWPGKTEFISAKREVWRLSKSDPEVAGYVRTVRNLQQVVVRGAGHMVPFDQPERALDMITRFIEGIPFSES
ncbi:probable serine carboxypeptidase CPVL [Sycon ciliatum]|uniref:probable serine carboxypeptidase CPVL n=1 Tax=Sycon ciliatum TaxID=27933 RepID=UPI0020AB85B2|eukprot:scpid47045/ scgid26881/ Probable serine carboxypeptidase CPVL; Carboxypeptidase, vitellogenic-like; Vitellogenic carboxypeptidase-like protein